MKIQSINIIDFGKFDVEGKIAPINPKVALFYGKNEAGKTTIFNLIKSLLYGFSPAKSESHPYSSRKNGRIEFSAKLSTRDGEAEVYRRLLSTPKGQVTIGDKMLDIKNNPVPYANHISSEIFNKVYSLKVEDLIEIQGRAWEDVQDKLLANYGNEIIKSTRDVLKEINEEATQYYRESGKGNYLIKELESKIKELKKEKNDAINREELLRKYDAKLSEIQALLENLNTEKIQLKYSIKKAKEIIPVKKLILEIEELKGKLVKEELCDNLPAGIKSLMEALEERIQLLNLEISRKSSSIKKKQEATNNINPLEEIILENKLKIDGYLRDIGKLTAIEEDLIKLKLDIDKALIRLKEESRTILKNDLTEEVCVSINRINYLELQTLLGINKKLKQELQEKQSTLDIKGQQNVEIKKSKAYIVATVIGVPLLALSIYFRNTPAILISGFIAFFGITGLINTGKIEKEYKSNWSKRNDIGKLEADIKELSEKLKSNKGQLNQVLKDIPTPEIIIEHSQEVFLSCMMRIKDLSLLLEEKTRELQKKEAFYQAISFEITEFLKQFNYNESMKLENMVYALKDELDHLEKQRALKENIRQEILSIANEVQEKQQQLEKFQEKQQSYRNQLELIGEGDAESGLIIYDTHVRLRSKIKLLEDRLSEMPSLTTILQELELLNQEEQNILSDIEVEKTELRLEDIEEEIKNYKVEKKEIEISMQQLMDDFTLGEIDSNMAVLEEKLTEACFKRDRLVLLADIIRGADEEFREENQPDVLKNASRYFSIITKGKYTNIFLEDNEGVPMIYLKEANNPSPRTISDNESKGTLNQLYLSLRLSLIDHLDQNSESLPICFDELLINWDEERLISNLQLLEEICNKRQIFIFTCHEWMAEKIEKHFNVERISLD